MARKLRPRKSKSDKDSSSSASPKTSPLSSTPKSEESESPSIRNIPDILYAEDGSIFFPCKYCCRAFANKPDLDKHVKVCSTGGRSTPSPFAKEASNKENDEILNNNNEEINKTPKRKVKEENNKRKGRSIARKVKKARTNSPDAETNVITTGSVSENIHNLNPEMKAAVLENIKLILKHSSISIISDGENPIIVKTAANAKQPALQITSRNINENCVEIKTVRLSGRKNGGKLPDIAEILEGNFGNTKPIKPAKRAGQASLKASPTTKTVKRPLHAQSILDDFEIEESEVDNDLKSPDLNGTMEIDEVKNADKELEEAEAHIKSIKSKHPKPVHEESLIGDSEIGEIHIDDPELEETIVLEDLDIHICKQCGSVYHSLEDLVNHDKYEHRNVKKRYPPSELAKFDKMFKAADTTTCPICSKVLSTKTAWPRHLQTHSDVLNYECRICKRKFTRNDHRKLHENRHVLNITDVDE